MFGEKYTEDRSVIETQEYLRIIFDYKDGRLIWKERPDEYYKSAHSKRMCLGKSVGKVVGSVKGVYTKHERHYWVCSIHQRHFRCSRLIWIWHNGEIPDGLEIDHINGDPLDDRIENLRVATRTQQLLNRSTFETNSTGYTGISFTQGKYKATLTRTFDTLEEAVEWRLSRANEDIEWLRVSEPG